MSTQTKPPLKLRLTFPSTGPFELKCESVADQKRFQSNQKKSKIKAGMERYLARIQELTRLNVPEPLRTSLPNHCHSSTRVLVVILENGIAIRYEPATNNTSNEVLIFSAKQKLQNLVPLMSVGLILVTDSDGIAELPEGLTPPTLNMGTFNEKGESVQTIVDGAQFQIRFSMPEVKSASLIGKVPPPVSLIRNQFEIGLEGVELSNLSDLNGGGRNFVTRGGFSFPLFWDAIGIYPWADSKEWRKADFESWAERHFFELAFHAATSEYTWLATASQKRLREHYTSVLTKLDALLALDDVIEEQLQQFLTSHPEVLVPGHKRVLPKLEFGTHVTDFVIEDATGQYLLVELENPAQPLFVKSGHKSSKLTHAEGQVKDWIRYIQDNKATVERELKLSGISAEPSALVVIGRSNSLSVEHRRKLQVDQGKIEVITYDDLRARFVTTIENLMGMLAHAGKNYDVAYLPNRSGS